MRGCGNSPSTPPATWCSTGAGRRCGWARSPPPIGISRQSLHAEFGTKDDLGNALVMRETCGFLRGMRPGTPRAIIPATSPAASRRRCLHPVCPRDNPLLETILTRTPANGDGDSLLPLLTVRGEPLIGQRDRRCSATGCASSGPTPTRPMSRLMVESVVRLCLSHILTPTKTPDAVAADLALVACRCLSVS